MARWMRTDPVSCLWASPVLNREQAIAILLTPDVTRSFITILPKLSQGLYTLRLAARTQMARAPGVRFPGGERSSIQRLPGGITAIGCCLATGVHALGCELAGCPWGEAVVVFLSASPLLRSPTRHGAVILPHSCLICLLILVSCLWSWVHLCCVRGCRSTVLPATPVPALCPLQSPGKPCKLLEMYCGNGNHIPAVVRS